MPKAACAVFMPDLAREVDDVLAEFLDMALAHERAAGPGLQGFLASMRKSDISIKRELAEQGGGVRVMTVHGAKGLEAPIVILADAATGPNTQKMGKPVYVVPDKPGPLLVHASSKTDHTEQTAMFRDADIANQTAEYWRKLYVGMTRAEDELYVTGVLTKTGKLDGAWYEAIETALANETSPCAIPGEETKGLIFPTDLPSHAPIEKVVATPAIRTAYVADIPPKPKAPPVIQPSRAHAKAEVFDSAAQSLVSADEARREGIAIHALLQHLSGVPEDMRQSVAHRALIVLLPAAPDRHQAIATKALNILNNPQNANLFGPDSRAEVPFLADLQINGKPARVAGRLDRLVVTDDQVLAVDFKSDANPPPTPEAVTPGYLTQLGLYQIVGKNLFPESTISAAIFWTATESLMILPDDLLTGAMETFTFTQPDLN